MRPHPFHLVAAALAMAACSDASPGPPLTLGLLTPVTGDLAARGRYFIDSALLVADQINSGGGMLGGRELRVSVKDTGTSAEGAMNGYADLLGEGVIGIVGPGASSEVIALRLQIRAGETLVVGPSSSSSAITTADFGGNFYRMVAPDSVQSGVLAELIDAKSLTDLCIVARDDVYGNGIADAVQARLATPPARITVAKYAPSSADLSHVLDPCGTPIHDASHRNGILFASLIADGAALIDLASSAAYGWTNQDQVFLTDGTRDPDLLVLLANPTFVNGALGTRARGPDPTTPEGAELAAFQTAFRAKFSRDPDIYSEMAFDAANTIALAVEIAGGTDDIERIRAALPKLATGVERSPGDWRAMTEEIARSGFLDYRGASGAVTFAPPLPDTLGPYFIEVWTIANGTPTTLMVRTVPGA